MRIVRMHDVTSASRCVIPPDAWLIIQTLIRDDKKETFKATYYFYSRIADIMSIPAGRHLRNLGIAAFCVWLLLNDPQNDVQNAKHLVLTICTYCHLYRARLCKFNMSPTNFRTTLRLRNGEHWSQCWLDHNWCHWVLLYRMWDTVFRSLLIHLLTFCFSVRDQRNRCAEIILARYNYCEACR